jgi:UDP-N-acetylmuramyl pentapeptide phosphotransferase/UDP-N-acetylglucosamine-1-phosphate transferase
VNLLTAITELISIFLFTTLFIFVARKAAKRVGLVDKPNYRKRHQGLIPLVGGISVLQAFVLRLLSPIITFPTLVIPGLRGWCWSARWTTALISA